MRRSPLEGTLPSHRSSADTAMAEFSLNGVRYLVFPEPGNKRLMHPQAATLSAASAIGTCRIDGLRYLICADRPPVCPSDDDALGSAGLLTPRELQIATMISEGYSNKQIADRLHLSCWTVSSYLRRIFGKLRVRTRAAMVARIIAGVRP